jgi:hypothetical protein
MQEGNQMNNKELRIEATQYIQYEHVIKGDLSVVVTQGNQRPAFEDCLIRAYEAGAKSIMNKEKDKANAN